MVGAALQYFYGRSLEQTKHFRELRSRAYVDFLSAVAALAAPRNGTESEVANLRLLTDAKIRIATYGSKNAVVALAAFCRTNQVLGSAPANSAFIRLVREMRRDSAADLLDERDFMTILLNE